MKPRDSEPQHSNTGVEVDLCPYPQSYKKATRVEMLSTLPIFKSYTSLSVSSKVAFIGVELSAWRTL